ncbi:MAG: ATP-binding protein [Saprospiraceae bacterium]
MHITARRISFIAAIVVIVTMIMSHWLFSTLLFRESQGTIRLVVTLATGIITYALTLKVISMFLISKVRHIFQMIHKPDEQTDLESKLKEDQPLLKEVELEVTKFLKTQNQELNSKRDLERYRQDFVGNVAHELKTPIFNIQGYVHTLQDGALEDEKVNRLYLQRASDNIDRMIKIIQDLDSVYKLESNQLTLEWHDIDLFSFVESMIDEMIMITSEKGVNLSMESEIDTNQLITADPDYLRQVFINLLENAIKYGNPNGQTNIKLFDLGEKVLVEIKDNGPGIDNKHLRHIFDRFYRVDKARSRAAGGSGLGLSIVKHIMEAHNQSIKVRSTPGVGTIFSFTLEKAKNKI